MKKSELKEMIKQAMLAESPITESPESKAKDMIQTALMDMGVDLSNPMSTNNTIYGEGLDDVIAMLRDGRDFEAEQHAEAIADQIYNNISLEEAEGDEEEAEEVEAEEEEISVEDELEDEVEVAPEMSGDVAEVQDHLEAALEVAKSMGDEKLATQIKNTQIYLTRSQTVKEEEEDYPKYGRIKSIRGTDPVDGDYEISVEDDTVEEDLFEHKRMLKLAGIIK